MIKLYSIKYTHIHTNEYKYHQGNLNSAGVLCQVYELTQYCISIRVPVLTKERPEVAMISRWQSLDLQPGILPPNPVLKQPTYLPVLKGETGCGEPI